MVHELAPANRDELQPVGQADPGRQVELVGEASEMEEEEGSKKLSEMCESLELSRKKTMDR